MGKRKKYDYTFRLKCVETVLKKANQDILLLHHNTQHFFSKAGLVYS